MEVQRRAWSGGARFDVIVFFAPWRADLEAELGTLRGHMAPACGLWIAWPKRAARVPTDMSDHVVREVALPTGLVDNKVCAIDAGLVRPPPGDPARAAVAPASSRSGGGR